MKIMKNEVKNIVLAAMFLCIGAVLPLLTSQIKEIGDTLLPMHFPVMLCAFICGKKYGGMVGLVLPLFRNHIYCAPSATRKSATAARKTVTYSSGV